MYGAEGWQLWLSYPSLIPPTVEDRCSRDKVTDRLLDLYMYSPLAGSTAYVRNRPELTCRVAWQVLLDAVRANDVLWPESIPTVRCERHGWCFSAETPNQREDPVDAVQQLTDRSRRVGRWS